MDEHIKQETLVNCLYCHFRHEDNGNCTAVGGFCTAVSAAHCPMLRKYLNIGLTPEQCETAKVIIESTFSNDTSKVERIRELLKADKDGRLVILPSVSIKPVVHGQWIERRALHAMGEVSAKCSACSKSVQYLGNPLNYCPNCGAKMDIEVEGDNNAID